MDCCWLFLHGSVVDTAGFRLAAARLRVSNKGDEDDEKMHKRRRCRIDVNGLCRVLLSDEVTGLRLAATATCVYQHLYFVVVSTTINFDVSDTSQPSFSQAK